jgi:hypothetical protein
MARIPIAQIPNAAPNIGQPSLLSPGVANLSGSSAALNRAAGQMQQGTLNINAFGAEGGALANIGSAMAGVSGQMGDIVVDVQNRINRARDNGKLAEADVMMRERRAKYDQEKVGILETEWVQRWNEKELPALQKDIEALGLSAAAQRQLEPSFIRYQSDTSVGLQTEAWKQTAANSRASLLMAAERSVMDGDFETAEVHLNKAVEDNLITRPDAEKLLMKMEEDQRTQEIHTAVSQDPFGVEADMTEALKKDGKGSEFFPWVNRPEQLRRIQSMAKQEAGRVRRESVEELDNEILSGALESEEEIIQRAAGVGLSERDTRSLVQSLYVEQASTPEGQAKYLGNFNEIRRAVVNYDPKADVDDQNYYSILRQIRSEVIPGEREALLDDLRTQRKDGLKPSDQIRRTLTNTVGEMRKAGLLGEVVELEKDRKGRTKNDQAHFESLMSVSQKESELLDEVNTMLKNNPGMSHDEAAKRFRDIVGRPVADQAASIFDQQREADKPPGFWNRMFGGDWGVSHGVPAAPLIKKAPGGTSATPNSNQQQQTAMKTTPIQQIVNLEARRDAQGRIAVYSLPSGDGGGSYEIAGINEKYHPGMAKRLRQLINAGQHGQAETEAGNYIKQYTDPVAKHATNPGVEFALRDTAFNRGPTGAARILQKALGVKVDGKIGPVTREALAKAEANPKQFLQDFRQAREWYERTYAKRAPGNKFWRGLTSRWNKQLEESIRLA